MKKKHNKQPKQTSNETPVLGNYLYEDIKVYFSPFDSPHILRERAEDQFQNLKCNRQLFEQQDDNPDLVNPESTKTITSLSQIPANESPPDPIDSCYYLKQILSQVQQQRSNRRVIKARQLLFSTAEFPLNSSRKLSDSSVSKDGDTDKENSIIQAVGFNQKMTVGYPSTPLFKKILKSPLPCFMSLYRQKIEFLTKTNKNDKAIKPVEFDVHPVEMRDYSYKLFLCIAESLKAEQAIADCRALYKIALHLQPFDEMCWDWAIKFEDELGQFGRAFTLAKAGFMFIRSQNLAEKYIKLSEKAEGWGCTGIEQVRGVMSLLPEGVKLQKLYRIYFEMAKNELKQGNDQIMYSVLYYLVNIHECNSPYIYELAKFLEAKQMVPNAISVLEKALQGKSAKLYPIYALYLKLMEQTRALEQHRDWLEYFLDKVKTQMTNQHKWKLLLDLAAIFMRIGDKQRTKECLKGSLEIAPSSSKWKPYLAIVRYLGLKTPKAPPCSAIVIEENREKFVNQQHPILYNFPEWKYYLHYSLFCVFQQSKEAEKYLRNAVNKWPYSGRLAAEMLWLLRTRRQASISDWERIIKELPKSGEVWCEGGRMYLEKKQFAKARFCLDMAMQLTPQYGDTFVEALKLAIMDGSETQIQLLEKKVLIAEPYYGNVWCFLKSDSKSSVIDIWKRAKEQVKQGLYQKNVEWIENSGPCRCLTASRSYNELFESKKTDKASRHRLFFAYQHTDPNKK